MGDRPTMRADDGPSASSLVGLELVSPRAISRGHFLGERTIEVRANDLARSALNDERPFPAGSRLLAVHADRDGGVGPTFGATKDGPDGGTWAFDVRGDRGLGARCAECHREAEHDYVFTRLGFDAGASK